MHYRFNLEFLLVKVGIKMACHVLNCMRNDTGNLLAALLHTHTELCFESQLSGWSGLQSHAISVFSTSLPHRQHGVRVTFCLNSSDNTCATTHPASAWVHGSFILTVICMRKANGIIRCSFRGSVQDTAYCKFYWKTRPKQHWQQQPDCQRQ